MSGSIAILRAGAAPARLRAARAELAAQLRPGLRVLVAGAGWAGCQLAADACAAGAAVTLIEREPAPLPDLGEEAGTLVAGLLLAAGVVLRTGATVTQVGGSPARATLADGTPRRGSR